MTRYCPIHERGWYPGGDYAAPQWVPLAAWKLRLALRVAQESGCHGAIVVRVEACDVCEKEYATDK